MSDDSGKFAEKIGVYVAPGGQAFIETQNIVGQKQLRPFQAPPLPTYYVDRPEYSQDLKTRLVTESSDVRTLVVTAIHGLGSVGKSTLAMALAHDEEVQKHFCDGILWATLGQQPNLLSLLSHWVEALGNYNFKTTSVEAASTQLRTLLYDKAVLLVVDDVWNAEDAQVFNVGGVRCQVLVTTREAAIAQVLRASIYPLDVMKPSQAMELLTKKLGRKLTSTETQSAQALAKEVGYLPLALELAAAQVAIGTSWTVLVQDMQQEIARLKTLDNQLARDATNEASLKKLSLTASLNLSIQRLSEEMRENFIWLGILPEDVTITQAMTAILWDIDDERDAADDLRYLHFKGLLLCGVPSEKGTPTYRLHDLFYDLARNLLITPLKPKRKGDLPGLGITLPDAHTTFLEKYRKKTSNNLWHTLPDDGYIHQRLVWHLEKAGNVEAIHELLREESKTGGNGWYEACASLGQTANFVTDVARAWQLAEDFWTEITLPEVIGLQCRYALIIASLNSLAANLPAELLIALVQKNVWTPEQGLAYVLQSSNPTNKVNLLTQLANHLPPDLKELGLLKALAAAREIRDESDRATALCSLADKLPELLPEALAAAMKIQDESDRAEALSNLAGKLPPELLPKALAAAREIQYDYNRAQVLSSLADKLPELLPEALTAAREIQYDYKHAEALSNLADKLPELLPEALTAAREIQYEKTRAEALSNLSGKLPSELLPKALTAAREIQCEESRAQVLSSLADKLPELLPEALAAAREIQYEKTRAEALSNLADKLPPELLPEALAAAREIQNEFFRVKALSSLAGKLPELLPEALAAAREIQYDYQRTEVLNNLADKLPLELLPEALAAAREIQDESDRATALSGLADKLPELLPEALAAAREIQDESDRAQVLSSLADKLPLELLLEALAAAREIQSEVYRAKALSSLADKLPELLPEALAAAREIQDESYRAKALSSLVDKLPELLPEALAAAREIQYDWSRAEALSSLADKLPELLPEALAAAREIENELSRAEFLNHLADKLPSELLPEALVAAREIQDEFHRAIALSSLAGKLPELLPEALAAAREIQHGFDTTILDFLADKLPPELLPEALAAAREIQDEFHRANALSSLADKLPPELLPKALAAAREIQDELSRATALGSLAGKLPELLPEVLALVRKIQYESLRATALRSLADKLLHVQKTPLFSLWRDTLHILSVYTRPSLLTVLNALTPVIFTLGDKLAVKDTANAIQDVSRWWG